MRTITKFGAASAVGATMLAAGAAQAGMSVPSSDREWNNPWHGSFCRLTLESLTQDNPGQRLRVGVRNNTNTRLQFGLAIRVRKPDGRTFDLAANYDNANPNELRQADTTGALLTALTPSRVQVRVTYCQERF
jgi:hypothetical protein